MLTVITKNLFVKPKMISLAKALQIIETQDPIVTTDWHILKEINKKQTDASYAEYVKKSSDMIKRINDAVKPGKPVLMLGDISEEEICRSDDLKLLFETVRGLHGSPKILIRGNNDDLDDDFYHKMGFAYIAKEKIVSERAKIIFSHIPVSIKQLGLSTVDWLNVHGHVHSNATLYNMEPEDADCHLNVYHDFQDQGIHTLSWYLSQRRNHPNRYHMDVIYKYNWS